MSLLGYFCFLSCYISSETKKAVALLVEMTAGPSWQPSRNRSLFCLEQPQITPFSEDLHHPPTSAHLHQQEGGGAPDYAELRVIIFLIPLKLFSFEFH